MLPWETQETPCGANFDSEHVSLFRRVYCIEQTWISQSLLTIIEKIKLQNKLVEFNMKLAKVSFRKRMKHKDFSGSNKD